MSRDETIFVSIALRLGIILLSQASSCCTLSQCQNAKVTKSSINYQRNYRLFASPVLNKYFPPDFDPDLIPRRKQPKNAQQVVRLMAPFSMSVFSSSVVIFLLILI